MKSMPSSRPTTLVATAGKIQAGHLAPLDMVEQCLSQIDAFEPRVHAWVLVDERGAREAARRAGEEIAAGNYRGPLHGVPLAIKDIVDVAGWPTLAGSRLRSRHRAQSDATVVSRLREAGAILLGKTVTTEFASFDPPPTRNPWNLDRTPGGSSSGSAAAVALGMCLGAIGSQTGGSITRPASFCGIAGCKPSFGRVSSQGVVPLSRHMDHVGPLARSTADLAAILQVIAGYDPHDATTADLTVPDYLEACRVQSPPRLALIADPFFETSDAMNRAMREAVRRLESGGAFMGEVRIPASFAEVTEQHRRLMTVEAAEYHQATFPQCRHDYGPCIASLLDEGLAATAIDYASALVHRRQLQRDMLAAFADFDALLTPATTGAAPGVETTGDPRFNSPWSYVGYPTISLPCALADDGLPLSLQLVGRPFDEARLFSAAAWCERALDFNYRPPLLAELET
ncbi:MAG TPA: amidase [Pirellulales bacterium]|nr:amidase [Pirellulales bacterium]